MNRACSFVKKKKNKQTKKTEKINPDLYVAYVICSITYFVNLILKFKMAKTETVTWRNC